MSDLTRGLTRRARWLGWLLVVCLVQIALIFWMSDYTPAKIRKPAAAPVLRMVGRGSAELLALSDPTLFALPHFRGFSGDAWLTPPPPPNRAFEWTEEPRWLPFQQQEFARTKTDSKTNTALNAFEVISRFAPEPSSLVISAPPQFREKSAIRIDGLATRRLLSLPNLPSWSSTNVLTNTVLRVMIDAKGIPRSQTVLVRSGFSEADAYALKIARDLRFEPVPETPRAAANPSVPALSWTEVVFLWHTLPATKTNK
jgi:hypothetical protein